MLEYLVPGIRELDWKINLLNFFNTLKLEIEGFLVFFILFVSMDGDPNSLFYNG